MTTEQTGNSQEEFDFDRHEQEAVSAYLRVHGFFGDLASAANRIAEEALKRRGIRYHSIEARAKDPISFGKKAAKPSKGDPSRPMYPDPLEQITDKAAIRVIAFFPRTIDQVDRMLTEEFSIIERLDKGESLVEEERFGYQSVHYLVALSDARSSLPEYERYRGVKIEVQVRTILQHAWAEIEHDIQYKSSVVIPRDIKRRFMSLAGLLEMADREFQAIQDADRDLEAKAQTAISTGQLTAVEITPSALKAYLDRRLGPDGRMKEFSYNWTAGLLRRLRFTSLDQIDEAIRSYDDDKLSRIADGARQGQLNRFEFMLLAAMGEKFVQAHPWSGEPWFAPRQLRILEKFKEKGIPVETFDPGAETRETSQTKSSVRIE